MNPKFLDPAVSHRLLQGTVIPAHPLALDADRRLDEARQRRLTRYYLGSGAGGIAVGVHTTQFAIRHPAVDLYQRVLRLAAEEVAAAPPDPSFIKVAGIIGPTGQALAEAHCAAGLGYHLGLLGMGGLAHLTEEEVLAHTREIASVIPIFGFYLQPSVGGRPFSYDFWLEFARIPQVHAIKVAAFNRYQTLDVVRAVCASGRADEIALYTGNDDNIVADLLTRFRFPAGGRWIEKEFVGGLLGHWAVWTERAVELLEEVRQCKSSNGAGLAALLTKGAHITDMNAALFDPAHQFHGCIAGIHEVLRRQGLLAGRWCLDPAEDLSPGQMEEIDRICAAYPHLTTPHPTEAVT
jgi:hypothetical protein